MKKILVWVIIIALSQMFFAFQARNTDKIDANKMYELTLQRNGVTE